MLLTLLHFLFHSTVIWAVMLTAWHRMKGKENVKMGVKGKQARGRRVDHQKKLNRKLVDFNSSTDSTAQLNPQRMEGE